MTINKDEFFRLATLNICSDLDFEIALQKCLNYLKDFMPADCLHLSIYERGLGALKMIAIVTSVDARRVSILVPLNQTDRKTLNGHLSGSSHIVPSDTFSSELTKNLINKTGIWKQHSAMVSLLKVKGSVIGNVVLFAEGLNRFSEEHLSLFSGLNEPFTIALSNVLRYDELNQIKAIMTDDLQYLHRKFQESLGEVIIGEDYGLKEVMGMVKEVASLDSTLLLQGETGVGKGLIANVVHRLSRRKEGPFIQVNCGAIPENLIDSELFGHEKGAFTGAIDQKRGCFERADKGTIFLDEIAELPLQAQVRFLSVLQEKKLTRIGGSKEIDVDIRIITATHQNIQEMVQKKLFRSDLWFRLHVFPIMIPPLRDRKEDIPALVSFFIEKKSKELRIPDPPNLAPGAIDTLMAYSWPGNIREFENVLERALILGKGNPLTFDELVWEENDSKEQNLKMQKDGFLPLNLIVLKHIKKALKISKGKVQGPNGAAEMLGLNPSTLRNKMIKLRISKYKG